MRTEKPGPLYRKGPVSAHFPDAGMSGHHLPLCTWTLISGAVQGPHPNCDLPPTLPIVFIVLSFPANPRNQTHLCLPQFGAHLGPSGFSVSLVPLLVLSSEASGENARV